MKTFKSPHSDHAARKDNPPPQKVDLAEVVARMHETPPVFEDEGAAPEVDLDVLRMLVGGGLPEGKARLIYRLIYSFKSWFDAHSAIVIEQAAKRPK